MFQFLRSRCAPGLKKSHSAAFRPTFERLEDRRVLSGTPPTVTAVHVDSSSWSAAFSGYLQSHGLGDYGYRIPVGSTSQAKSIPWFNVDKIAISFSEDVTIQREDLSLSGISSTNVQAASFFYDAFTHVATWKFVTPLAKDVYQLDLDGNGLDPVRDLEGNMLDGEWTNNADTYPSGNSIAGGDFAYIFRVMPGDVNQNGGVEYYDYGAVNGRQGQSTTSGNYLAFADVDGSGTINSTDTQLTLSKLWSTYPSGAPAGVNNDAPTTTGLGTVSVNNPSVDVNVPLFAAIADAETSDAQMSYSVVSNSNPSLFDSVTINTATGNLVLNSAASKSGRANIVVAATDQGGLTTYMNATADVNYTNLAPYLNFIAITEGYNTWTFQGSVSDADDIVEGMIVTFTGAYNGRATVQADGTFEFAVIIEPDDWGNVVAHTEDSHGLGSNFVNRIIGWT